MSYCNGDHCTDLRHAAKAKSNASVHGLERWGDDLSHVSWQRLQGGLRRQHRNRSIEATRDSTWLAPFSRLLSISGKGWVRVGGRMRYLRLVERAPLVAPSGRWWHQALRTGSTAAAAADTLWNAFPHEGSFYSVALLRAFVASMNGSTYFNAMEAHLNRSTRCPCCRVYPDHRRTAGHMGGACAFEEFLLPTYARQRYSHLIARTAPPVVLRLWIDLRRLVALNGTSKLVDLVRSVRESSQWRHIFGLKVPRHSLPSLLALLGAVDGLLGDEAAHVR